MISVDFRAEQSRYRIKAFMFLFSLPSPLFSIHISGRREAYMISLTLPLDLFLLNSCCRNWDLVPLCTTNTFSVYRLSTSAFRIQVFLLLKPNVSNSSQGLSAPK